MADALYKYSVGEGAIVCSRCVEVVGEVDQKEEPLLSRMKAEQVKKFGDFEAVKKNGCTITEEGLAILVKENVRVVVSNSLRKEMLYRTHGDADAGHYGVTRSMLRLKERFWWEGCAKDLQNHNNRCVACEMARIDGQAPDRQGLCASLSHPPLPNRCFG